jgi:DNA processing protein
VVSGAARGIDAAAHRGALEAGGPTVAVLGSGIDVAYPRQNRDLLEQIADRGTVLSEYPPGTPAEPFRFPARNRIVAGLARAVVVVEGAQGSGSMITAEHSLDLGRDVFAVPGQVTSQLAQAPLRLIREGAVPIRGPDDLLEDLGLEPVVVDATDGSSFGSAADGADASRAVWTALTGPATVDRLAAQTGRSLSQVTGALIALEIRGMVRQVGGRYERRLVTGPSGRDGEGR